MQGQQVAASCQLLPAGALQACVRLRNVLPIRVTRLILIADITEQQLRMHKALISMNQTGPVIVIFSLVTAHGCCKRLKIINYVMYSTVALLIAPDACAHSLVSPKMWSWCHRLNANQPVCADKAFELHDCGML